MESKISGRGEGNEQTQSYGWDEGTRKGEMGRARGRLLA